MSFLLQFKDWISQSIGIDDTVDRLNRKYTCILILLVAIPVFSKQYIGDPVLCFTPTFFTDAMSDYVNSYCWTSTTYVLYDKDANKMFPLQDHAYYEYVDDPTRTKLSMTGMMEPTPGKYQRILISYYRWTPIVLTIQALLFHVPFLIWHSFAIGAGIQIKCLMTAAKEISKLEIGKETRVAIIFDFVDQFNLFMGLTRWRKIPDCMPRAQKHLCCGRKFGNYLYSLYMTTKGFYIFNIVFQLYGLTVFLGQEQWTHGFKVIEQFLDDETWVPSMRFPIQTMCDYAARPQMEQNPTHVRRSRLTYYTAQCVLPINLYNDKIYAGLTTLFMILFLITLYGFVKWCVRGAQCNRLKFIKKYLHSMGKLDTRFQKTMMPSFVHWYLRQDGVFILQIIEHNCGKVVTSVIIEQIWEQYLQRRDQQKIHEKETNKENNNGGVEVVPLESLRAHFGGGGGGSDPGGGGNDVNVLMTPSAAASLLKIPRDSTATDNIYPSYDHLPFPNRDLMNRNVNININNSDDEDDAHRNTKPPPPRGPGARNLGLILGLPTKEPSAPPLHLDPESPTIRVEEVEDDYDDESEEEAEEVESEPESQPSREVQRISSPIQQQPSYQSDFLHSAPNNINNVHRSSPPSMGVPMKVGRSSPPTSTPNSDAKSPSTSPVSVVAASAATPPPRPPLPLKPPSSSSANSSRRNTPTSTAPPERVSPHDTFVSRNTPPTTTPTPASIAPIGPSSDKWTPRPPNGHAYSPVDDGTSAGYVPVAIRGSPSHLQPSPLSPSTSTSPSPNPSELGFPKPPERFQ